MNEYHSEYSKLQIYDVRPFSYEGQFDLLLSYSIEFPKYLKKTQFELAFICLVDSLVVGTQEQPV